MKLCVDCKVNETYGSSKRCLDCGIARFEQREKDRRKRDRGKKEVEAHLKSLQVVVEI